MTWEKVVDEIDRTILIAAKERGYLNQFEKNYIVKHSERAVEEAQKL